MLKPYKEELPVLTVNKIRNILNDIGIFVTEEYKQDGDYHTCRLEIANEKLKEFNIGTNGKGTSVEYCYASAYAEFMERLQNSILIKKSYYFSKYFEKASIFSDSLKSEDKLLDFLFDPEEKMLDMDKIIDDNYKMLSGALFIESKEELKDFVINTLNYKKAICVPFYNKTENKVDFLPLELLFLSTGSNGMCAGNTPEEALIQGIGEILERYTIREIHKNNITPPTIPHDYFSEYPIYDSIKKLENSGFEIIIKDFSLGKGLPVIGVIVINKEDNTYNVKVGSDPWPIIALERCLTELHQSFNGIRLIDKNGFGDYIEEKYQNIDRIEAEHINLRNIFTNASGHWPDSIIGERFSYEFEGLNFTLGRSNKTDLEYLTNLVEKLGSQVYIRDVSYLGFNSYYIITPGLSQQKTSKSDYNIFYNLYLQLKNLNNVNLLEEEELASLVNALEKSYVALKENHISFSEEFFYNTDKQAFDLELDLFLCMANYKLNNISKAYYYIDTYLKDKNKSAFLYFLACKDYLALKMQNKSENEMLIMLSKLYSKDLTLEVIGDMKDPSKIFKSFNLQSYFDSNNCNIEEFNYYPVSSILKKMQEIHLLNPIDQFGMSNIFYSN